MTRLLTPRSVAVLTYVFSINPSFLGTSLDTAAISLLCRWNIQSVLDKFLVEAR